MKPDWPALCTDAASGRRDACGALLAELYSASGAQEEAALGALVDAPPRLWPLLDYGVRRQRAPREPVSNGLLGQVLSSMSRDGRVRESAVRGLGLGLRGPRLPAAACALALRTVDWVRPVREDARAALLAGPPPADVAAATVRLLIRLESRERAGGVLGAFRELLTAPGQRATVRRLAADTDPATRRFGVALALDLHRYTVSELERTALHDTDQVCRRMCAERLFALDPDRAGPLLHARSAAVRELAVAALPEDLSAASLSGALADRSRPVRAQARWKLYRRGEPPVQAYRNALRRCGPASPMGLVAGLAAGLGECGDASDVPMLARLAGREPLAWESPQEAAGPPWPPPVRRNAVRALGRLADGEVLLRELLPLLDDEAPSVAREALDALRPYASRVPPGAAWTAFERPVPSVRRAALRLIRASGPWRRLEADLAVVTDPRPEHAAEAVGDLRAWLGHQVWSRPGPDQLQRLRALLEEAGGMVPDDVRRELAFVLKG